VARLLTLKSKIYISTFQEERKKKKSSSQDCWSVEGPWPNLSADWLSKEDQSCMSLYHAQEDQLPKMKIAFVIVTLTTLGLSAGDVDISNDNLEPEAVGAHRVDPVLDEGSPAARQKDRTSSGDSVYSAGAVSYDGE
jgi:hypothetical protein